MGNDLVTQRSLKNPDNLSLLWRWRSTHGTMHYPREMETRHLHNTLRMIWNNIVPREMRIGRVRLYTFHPYYTRAYFAEAVRQIGGELFRRDDLTPQQKRELHEMESWFAQWSEVENRTSLDDLTPGKNFPALGSKAKDW